MTKRRRSEDVWDELPTSQEGGNPLTVSAERSTVGQARLEGGLDLGSEPVTKGEGQQLAAGNLADVAIGRAVSSSVTEVVLTNTMPPAVTEADTTRGLEQPNQEPVPVNRLREGEVDVAGQNPADPYWFWELLAEAGWDVC